MISAFALGASSCMAVFQVNLGAMTIGGIQAFITYITFMLWPIQDLARVYAETAERHRLCRAHVLADRCRSGCA